VASVSSWHRRSNFFDAKRISKSVHFVKIVLTDLVNISDGILTVQFPAYKVVNEVLNEQQKFIYRASARRRLRS
jgi:hypothetical protein